MTDADDDLRPPTNPLAVISVVCGVVGCLGFTPLLAVVTGAIGVARGGPGRRTSAIGLSLGVVWLLGYLTLGGVYVWMNRHGGVLIADYERGRVVDLINHLPGGRVKEYPPGLCRIGPTHAAELAAADSSFGACRDVTVRRAAFTNRDGVFGVELHGTAVFDRGTLPVRVRLFFRGTGWGFSELDWQ